MKFKPDDLSPIVIRGLRKTFKDMDPRPSEDPTCIKHEDIEDVED